MLPGQRWWLCACVLVRLYLEYHPHGSLSPTCPSIQMSSRYREDGVGSRGEARNESVLGFLAKTEPVPSFSHWAWGHVGGMYSWIRIHTKDTTWKYPIGSRVAGSSWKIRRNERSLCNFGGLSRAVLLGTVKLRGRRVGRWQLLTFLGHSTIGNLDECCRPLRKADMPSRQVCRLQTSLDPRLTLARWQKHHKHSQKTTDTLVGHICNVYHG